MEKREKKEEMKSSKAMFKLRAAKEYKKQLKVIQ